MRLILLIFLMWSAAATAETRLALLISNEKYPEKAAGSNLFGPLGKAHRDREQMAEALKKYRFEMTEVLDADKDKMDMALVAFTKKLEESGADSVGVIYFVGHGAEVGGELYLIPTQEKHADDKAIRNRAIKANELIDRLTTGIENGKNQGVRLLILDACRSRIKTRGVNERKLDLNAHGALVGYAAASGKEAVDSDDSYTMHLTKQMKLNGHLKIEEVFKKARIELAKASGNNQISLEYGGLLGDFCLDNCQSNPLEKDLKAKEQELADLKQKLPQNKKDSIPFFSKRLIEKDVKFEKFVSENDGKTVELDLTFQEGDEPYDYKGNPDLAIWNTGLKARNMLDTEDVDIEYFFDCKGSWDQKTGYAINGRIKGTWNIFRTRVHNQINGSEIVTYNFFCRAPIP